jgi:dephospho-CoA kinase
MGKSTTAAMLRRFRWPVFDADAAVHRLMAPGGAAVQQVAAEFPGVLAAGGIDRRRLGAKVFADPAALRRLEGIVHPLVAKARQRFLRQAASRRARVVVLDIPLLFETGAEAGFDAVIVVTAPPFLQRQRALARPGMTAARLAGILSRQVPDHRKRRLATLVVPTGLGRRESLRRLLTLRKSV